MAGTNKVPWLGLLDELRNRDDRWEKLLNAKFNPLQDEIKQMENQLTQICELSADNETRIGKLETNAEVAKVVQIDCKEDKRVRAELHLKRWHVWVVLIAAGIYAAAMITVALL